MLKVKTETDEVTTELHTQGGETRSKKAPAGPYTITLVKLEPEPRSTAPIEPAAYRATLKVGRE